MDSLDSELRILNWILYIVFRNKIKILKLVTIPLQITLTCHNEYYYKSYKNGNGYHHRCLENTNFAFSSSQGINEVHNVQRNWRHGVLTSEDYLYVELCLSPRLVIYLRFLAIFI